MGGYTGIVRNWVVCCRKKKAARIAPDGLSYCEM